MDLRPNKRKRRINPNISEELSTNPNEDSQFPFNQNLKKQLSLDMFDQSLQDIQNQTIDLSETIQTEQNKITTQ